MQAFHGKHLLYSAIAVFDELGIAFKDDAPGYVEYREQHSSHSNGGLFFLIGGLPRAAVAIEWAAHCVAAVVPARTHFAE
jgi:hypothetical protein